MREWEKEEKGGKREREREREDKQKNGRMRGGRGRSVIEREKTSRRMRE